MAQLEIPWPAKKTVGPNYRDLSVLNYVTQSYTMICTFVAVDEQLLRVTIGLHWYVAFCMLSAVFSGPACSCWGCTFLCIIFFVYYLLVVVSLVVDNNAVYCMKYNTILKLLSVHWLQKLSTGVLQSSVYSLKPLKRINTNTWLSIKIEVKKVGLEFRDTCNVPNVCWQRVPDWWTSHWKYPFSKLGVGQWNCIWKWKILSVKWPSICQVRC